MVMMLVERRRLGLDDTIGEHLADVPAQWREATILPNRTSAYELKSGRLANAFTWAWRPNAAGGLSSSVTDLVKFHHAREQGRLISNASLLEMRRPMQLKGGPPIGAGLGTQMGWVLGAKFYGHTGSGGGGTSAIAYYPAAKLIIAVATNTEHDKLGAPSLQWQLARRLFKLRVAKIPLTSAELQRYVGTWSTGEVRLKIFEQGGKLMGQADGAPAPDELEYFGNERFILRSEPRQGVSFSGSPARAESAELSWAGYFVDVLRRVPQQ